MEKTKINEIEDLSTINGASLLCYDKNAHKMGFVPISNVTGKGYAGVKFRKNDASPEGIPEGDFEMIAQIPSWLRLGGYLVQNDHSRRKLSPQNHHFYDTGEPAALDGSEGHYQWGWGVEFYYANWEDEDFFHEAISPEPIPHAFNYKIPVASMSRGYAALDRTNNILVSYCNRSAQFRGGNNDASLDSTDHTHLGKPVVNVNADSLQRYAEKNGERWGASMFMMFTILGAIERIVFHNRNIQASRNAVLTADGLHQGGLGSGPNATVTDWGGAYSVLDIDALADMGDALGVFSVTKGDVTISGVPLFFGLLAPYHYLYCMQHGVVVQGQADKSLNVFALEEWNATPVPVSTVTGLTKVGAIPSAEEAGWVYPKRMNFARLCMYPLEFGASTSTFYCDGFYHAAITAGLRGLRVLGYVDDGADAGSCCLRAYYAPSYANVNLGASLCEADANWSTMPTWVP